MRARGRMGVWAPDSPQLPALPADLRLWKRGRMSTHPTTARARGRGRPARVEDAAGVPRIALTIAEAAASLGVSRDSFERYVMGDVRCIRRGRLRLYPVDELKSWAARNAEFVLPERRSAAA